jgi:hypothetical protein
MKFIQLSSQLVGVTPLADKGMGLRFHTKDLSAEDKIFFMENYKTTGWLLYKVDETGFAEQDIQKGSSGYMEGKTPSSRLRAVIYRYWEQFKKNDAPDFEIFYREAIETHILAYKEKLVYN